MVRFVSPADSGDVGPGKLLAAIRHAVPECTALSAPAQSTEPAKLLLVPVEYPVSTEQIEQIWNDWMRQGVGTVLRLPDGRIISRIIPVSMQPGIPAPAELRFFLDGTDDQVLVVGDPDDHEFRTLISDLLAASTPESLSKPDLDAFESYIRKRFKTDFPPLAYHNPDHILDVYEAAIRIADAEGVTESEKDLLRVAALLHDSGFIHTAVNHEKRGAEMAASVMPAFGFNPSQVSLVEQMILATKVPQSPVSHLDRIICDADLDYLGRDDFYSIGGKLYIELLAIGVVKDDQTWNTLQKKFLEAHRFHTDFSKTNREPEKQARLKEIITLLS